MTVRFIALLLCLVGVEVAVSYKCTGPMPSNCMNHPRVILNKVNNTWYQFFVCSSNPRLCMPAAGVSVNWINCSEVCGACKMILNDSECVNNTKCEQEIDTFFDDYCASLKPKTVTTRTDVITRGSQATTVTVATTTDTRTSISLGVLLGLSILLLTVVITGWAWTCWTMKKLKEAKSQTQERITEITAGDNYERSFDNLTYENNFITPSAESPGSS